MRKWSKSAGPWGRDASAEGASSPSVRRRARLATRPRRPSRSASVGRGPTALARAARGEPLAFLHRERLGVEPSAVVGVGGGVARGRGRVGGGGAGAGPAARAEHARHARVQAPREGLGGGGGGGGVAGRGRGRGRRRARRHLGGVAGAGSVRAVGGLHRGRHRARTGRRRSRGCARATRPRRALRRPVDRARARRPTRGDEPDARGRSDLAGAAGCARSSASRTRLSNQQRRRRGGARVPTASEVDDVPSPCWSRHYAKSNGPDAGVSFVALRPFSPSWRRRRGPYIVSPVVRTSSSGFSRLALDALRVRSASCRLLPLPLDLDGARGACGGVRGGFGLGAFARRDPSSVSLLVASEHADVGVKDGAFPSSLCLGTLRTTTPHCSACFLNCFCAACTRCVSVSFTNAP